MGSVYIDMKADEIKKAVNEYNERKNGCKCCDGTTQICDTRKGSEFDLTIDRMLHTLDIYVEHDRYGHECMFETSIEINFCLMCGRKLSV